MQLSKVVTCLLMTLIAGCGQSSTDGQGVDTSSQSNNPQAQNPEASCQSTDISVFCVSINGADNTLYVLTEDSSSPLLYNPYVVTRFDTTSGITLVEVRFDITPTSFIKAASVIFSGNTTGSYTMDGSGNFAGYTLAADQSWTFINGFSTGSVDITRYGAVGEFVTGSFSAKLCDSNNAILNNSDCTDSTYLIDISGNFNVVRSADV